MSYIEPDNRLERLKERLECSEEEAVEFLDELDLLDPLRKRFVMSWETENPNFVVWGTHNTHLILREAEHYYRNVVGLSEDEFSEMGFTHEFLKAEGKFLWAAPGLVHSEEEIWQRNLYGEEPKGPWWIPFFSLSY